MSFESFGFHPSITKNINTAGYVTPTPIQQEAIPVILEGRDVLGIAQTGTGKTAAFALPIIEILSRGKRARNPQALILTPTRELADQVCSVFLELGKHTGLHAITIYGGASFGKQVNALRRGADIVVACPGRLLDHLQERTINLSQITALVLDEADQMFDMGFLPTVRRIVRQLPAVRQNMLFTATMPHHIKDLCREVLRNPHEIRVESASASPVQITHKMFEVLPSAKKPALLKILSEIQAESVLVFTKMKHKAKEIGQALDKAGFSAIALHGNLSQGKRREAMQGFRDGRYQIMVATDIAARGIDVSQVSHVINFDMPDTIEAYTHRTGRTGRAARSGDAISLVTFADMWMLRHIERLIGSKPELIKDNSIPTESDRGGNGSQPSHSRHHQERPAYVAAVQRNRQRRGSDRGRRPRSTGY